MNISKEMHYDSESYSELRVVKFAFQSTLYVGLKTETDNVYGVISIITYSHINSPYPLITRFLS